MAAVIVLKQDHTLTQDQVIEYLFIVPLLILFVLIASQIRYSKKHLADYKCPKIVKFVPEFPRTATGKIQKNKVVEQLVSAKL